MNNTINKIMSVIVRNRYLSNGKLAKKHRVNLEYWDKVVNIGDQISKPIVEWMLERKGLRLDQRVKHTSHLLALGSIIGCGHFDATIWGSGINTPIATYRTGRWRKSVKYDVKAVRGPLTKQVLESFGYDCSQCVFGDPGILMPYLYVPESSEKKYGISVIKHFKTAHGENETTEGVYHFINVETDDYKEFINEIVASGKVISSSLHGIILSEAYGVPAVFLNENGSMDREIVKYYDWYYSTGRRNVYSARTIEEAVSASPMPLPDLQEMRDKLMDSFPYEMWE